MECKTHGKRDSRTDWSTSEYHIPGTKKGKDSKREIAVIGLSVQYIVRIWHKTGQRKNKKKKDVL